MARCTVCDNLVFKPKYCVDPTAAKNYGIHPFTDATIYFCGPVHSLEWHTEHHHGGTPLGQP